jgi:hypothetical protein
MHFTPTSASWLNMVERFFRDITDKRIRRDSFTSVQELELAIDLYVAHCTTSIPSRSSGPPAPARCSGHLGQGHVGPRCGRLTADLMKLLRYTDKYRTEWRTALD